MSQQPFGDIPLFREIQRLLAAGSGPVNFEMARQVGIALALEGGPASTTEAALERSLAEAARTAHVLVAGYTRIPFEEAARVKVITRTQWVEASIESWKWLFEQLATRFVGQLSQAGGGEDEANAMRAALDQIAPLLIGVQVGTLLGQLSKETLDAYDLPLPRSEDEIPFFVHPNVAEVRDAYGFQGENFTNWLALHAVARQVVMNAAPWVRRYFKSLLTAIVDALELDAGDLERRLTELQSGGPEALQGAAGASALPIVQTERHRRALDRLHAFLAAFHGYADHACEAVAGALVADTARIDEGMARRRASASQGKTALESVLGISFDRNLETSGRTFAAAVVDRKGIAALNRVWEAPDNVPVIGEIRDPFAWMERVLE